MRKSGRRRRDRIAIICGSLAQAGTERYVYELCRGLDKNRFAVELLTIVPWGVSRQYYAEPIRKLGIPIRPILPLFHWRRLPARIRRYALAGQEIYRIWILPKLLARYELLAAVHMDYLADVNSMLPLDATIVLHLTTHLCQHPPDFYRTKFPRCRSVFLVCMDGYQAEEARRGLGSAIRGQRIVPLPIDSSAFEEIAEWRSAMRPVIGCFIRIEPDREHMPLLRAFALLTKEIDAELHCYGRGDPSFLKAEAIKLGIEGRVKFPGHVSDIRRAVVDNQITLAWATSADEFMGYASIELSLWGVSTYFYNHVGIASTETILRRTEGAVHSYKTELELAQASAALLKKPRELREVGNRLRKYVQGHNDSRHVGKKVELFYEEILRQKHLDPQGMMSRSEVA